MAAERILISPAKKWRYGLFLSTNKNVWAVEIGSRAFNCDTILNQRRLIVSEGKFFLFLFSLGKWPEIDASRFPAAFCIPSFIIEYFRRKFSVSRQSKPLFLNLWKRATVFRKSSKMKQFLSFFSQVIYFVDDQRIFLSQNCVWGCQVSWKLASGFKFISGKSMKPEKIPLPAVAYAKHEKIKVSREN